MTPEYLEPQPFFPEDFHTDAERLEDIPIPVRVVSLAEIRGRIKPDA